MKHRSTPRALAHAGLVGGGQASQVRPRLRPHLDHLSPPDQPTTRVTDKGLKYPAVIFACSATDGRGGAPTLVLDETRKSTTIRAAPMRRVNAARLDISPRCAFLRDFPNSNSARVLNTILTSISYAWISTRQETRGSLALVPAEAMSDTTARRVRYSNRGGGDRGGWRAAVVLVACLLTSCFSVALSACVANVAPSTYDLRVGEVEIDRLHRRDIGLDVGGVSKQSGFGTEIALDGDTMLVYGWFEMDDDKTSQNKGPGSRHTVSGVRVYVRKVPGDKESGWREHWQSPFLSSGNLYLAVHGDTFVILRGDGYLETYTRLVPGDLNSEWTQLYTPTYTNLSPASVSMHGNLLVMGGYYYQDSSQHAIVYRRASANENWQASSQPLPRPSWSSHLWAYNVRLHGEIVVVSDRGYADGHVCVYSYRSDTDSWGLDECLEPDRTLLEKSMANSGTLHFGQSIDIDGGTIVVGGTSTCDNRGAAWVFERRQDSVAGVKWVQTSTLFAADTARDRYGDQFGYSVAIDGGTIAVSSLKDTSEDNSYDTPGAIYIFTVGVTGDWTPRGKIWPHSTLYQYRGSYNQPRSPYYDSLFGSRVVLHDDTLVVGASRYKPNATATNPDTGAVFVYALPGKNKYLKNFAADEIATLQGTSNDGFIFDHIKSGTEFPFLVIDGGYPVRVDMDEDFMVIAARDNDKDKVLVYARENRTLIAELTPSDGDGPDGDHQKNWIGFGASVAISGGTVVVGAIDRSIDPESCAENPSFESSFMRIGAAYVFNILNSTTGIRTEDQKLLPGPDPCAYAIINKNRDRGGAFGASVAIDGDTIVVGNPWASIDYDGDGQVNDGDVGFRHGTVHVYTRDDPNSNWVWGQELRAREMQEVDPSWDANVIHTYGFGQEHWAPAFGHSVGVSGHTIVVGSYAEDAILNSGQNGVEVGSAYVFARNASSPQNWAARAWLKVRDQYPSNMMGSSVAIDGDTIAVGALGQDNINSDTDNHGAVHVFARDVPGDPNSGWTQIEKLRGEHDLPNGNLNGRSNVALNLGASVDIYGDVIIAGGVMQSADFVGAAYIFTRDQSGEPSSTWTQRDRIVTGEVQENFGARGVVVHGDLAMIASGGGRAYGDNPPNKVRVYRLPCPELDITDPNTCSCEELMLLNGFQIADESSSPSSGCYGPAPTYLLPPPPAAAPSMRFIVTHPSTSDSEWYGDCACICNKQKYGDINVEGDVSGKGISFQVCTEQGPEKCRELASTHQAFDNCTDAGGKPQNFTTDWDYNSNYTGAIWTPPPPPFTAPPPTTTMPPPSGNTTPLGDCECMCDDASWSTQTWINKVDCPSGQVCPASEDMCSNQGLSECQAMNTNNQYCEDGVVSTAWTYVEAYDSSTAPPPPPSTAPAGDGGHYGGSDY